MKQAVLFFAVILTHFVYATDIFNSESLSPQRLAFFERFIKEFKKNIH